MKESLLDLKTISTNVRREADAAVNQGKRFLLRDAVDALGALTTFTSLTLGKGTFLRAALVWGIVGLAGAAAVECAAQKPYPPLLDKGLAGDATPTEKQKAWALAVSGIFTEINNQRHGVLDASSDNYRKAQLDGLAQSWGIRDKKTLLERLQWLECGGHRQGYNELVAVYEKLSPQEKERVRKEVIPQGGEIGGKLKVAVTTRERFKRTSIAGWDFVRYVMLCIDGYNAGFITEEEAWQRIMPVARTVQKTFPSWAALADNFLEGREFWGRDPSSMQQMRDIASMLKWDNHSPWRRLDWKLSLTPETQKDDGAKEYNLGRARFDPDRAMFLYYGSEHYWLGRTYFNPHGIQTCVQDEDRAEAVRLFKAAAEKGNVDAMYWLGLCARWGVGGLPRDVNAAMDWLKKAAAQGDTPSMVELADIAHSQNPKDGKQVFEWARKAVDAGDGAVAEMWLGRCYYFGLGTEAKQFHEAFKWFEKAAKAGEPHAQNCCGEMLRDGEGVTKDLAAAAGWFRNAAMGRDKGGMFNWAQCLDHGTGVPKDEDEALRWYRKASKWEHKDAQKRLAELESKKE